MFIFAKIKQNTEMLSNYRHILKNRRTGLSQIHYKINEGIRNFTVCFKEYSSNLRYNDVKIGLKIMFDVLVNK